MAFLGYVKFIIKTDHIYMSDRKVMDLSNIESSFEQIW